MANTDTLLDFGDDSPTSPKKADLGDSIGPSANGDPFDPFGSSLVDENQLISDPLEPSELDDPFDPFSGPRTTKSDKMENGTTALSQDDTQKYEAQFADLLGDLSGDGITMENGEIDGGTVTTITKTDIIEDGDGSQQVSIRDVWPPEDPSKRVAERLKEKMPTLVKTQEKEPGTPTSDKKAIDYMKERYQDKPQMEKIKIIREPKKLDVQWGKEPEGSPLPDGKEVKPLPKEQDLVQYTSLGTDYSRKQYENRVEKETSDKDGKALIPVNRQVVEKVAPPEITKNVRAMFETGNLMDLHEVKKTKIDEPPPESGVYENAPAELDGVVRSSDINMEGEELEAGITKNLLDQWKTMGQDQGVKERKKINLTEDEGRVLENEPVQRTDVVRESDADQADIALETGHAKNLKNKFLNPEQKIKEKKVIKLVENEEEQTVFENEPARLEGVVRSEDYLEDETRFERGKAKNLKGFWLTRTDEVDVKKEAIKIERDGGAVLENEPEVLEGVVRGDDIQESERNINLESGRTKNMASMWQTRSADEGPKTPRQPIKLDLEHTGPSVIENEPVELEGVVRCETMVEEVIPGNRGRTKDIAGKFLKEEEQDTRPRQMIEIDRATGPVVLENEPAPAPEGVVRADSVNEDLTLDTGRTKNMISSWCNLEKENLSPKTSYSSSNGKPSWMKEIEAAKDSGVFENEPAQNEGVVRETDIPEDEKQQLIPDNYTKSMKNMWLDKEKEDPAKTTAPELVRFTPPRELTPPPLNQQEYQSVQKLTLSPQAQNGHVNGLDAVPQQQPQYDDAVQQQKKAQQNRQAKRQLKQQHQQAQQIVEEVNAGPPPQTVKSSTTLVFK